MDFATRDRYRHAIEELARGSGRSELDVARQAIARAKRAAAARPPDAPPGDRAERSRRTTSSRDGRPLLEKAIGYRVPLKQRLLRAYVSRATPGYLGTIGVVTALLLALPAARSRHAAGMSPLALVLLGLVALIPASDLARRARQPRRHRICSARGRCRASSCATASRRACERSS